MFSILVASPHPALRAGLRVFLTEAECQAAGEADSAAACLAWAAAADVQLVLYDLALDDEALSGLWRLRKQYPALPVLALAETANGAQMVAALQAGAQGCLPKTVSAEELAQAVRSLAQGEAILPPAAALALLAQLRGETPGETLTPREAEVLRGVAAGQTNKALALKLGISEHTIKFHLSAAMSKLGAASRAEAVAVAMQRGLISI